jgi:hypothetical protein
MVVAMGRIARAVRRGDWPEALEVMARVWDGDECAAAYALREVFGVDVASAFPLIEPRLP